MDFLKYLKDVNAQKQIDILAKKYTNKKIVLYGAGIFADVLLNSYDMSKLNIIAIADKKYNNNNNELFAGYKTISQEELSSIICDVIFVSTLDTGFIIDYLNDELLIGTQNENIEILSLIKPTFLYCVKTLFLG